MDSLSENIAKMAQHLNHLIEDARQRQQQARVAQTTPLAELMALIALQSKVRIEIPRPLGWPGWPTGLWPKGVSLLQRLSHRSIAWMIGSLVAQQNQFNATVVRAIHALLTEQAEMRNAAQQRQTAYEARLVELNREITRLQEQMAKAQA